MSTATVPLPVRAAALLELRRRQNPMTFRQFIDKTTGGRFQWYWHAEQLADVLQRVADDEVRRLMVFMPPRHGKSEQVSRLFPAYYLYRHPSRWVGLNSYAADLAFTFSRSAREHYLRIGGSIKSDAGQVKHWETERGGGLWAAGVGGPITGKGFHLGIIDDPLKNSEEAASETIRNKQREWYESTFYTREEPGGAIVVIQTRWHDLDLSGYLLEKEGEDEPEGWHVVHFEAVKEAETPKYPAACSVEADTRAPGEPLCPERYPLDRLNKIAKRIGSYFWAALFQQRPRPKEGGKFKLAWFNGKRIDAKDVPTGGRAVRWWDKAATDGGGDYTVGARIRRVGSDFYVEDVVRGQWSSGKRDEVIRETADRDGKAVEQWSEQEPGSGGKDSALAFVRMLVGFTARTEPATGDKETRADPFAAQCEGGNVYLVRGSWLRAFEDELSTFPTGAHDDQVDAASSAFNVLARHGPRSTRISQW